jgi:hypothetical protein
VLQPIAGFEQSELASRVTGVDWGVIALTGFIRPETQAALLSHDAPRMRRSIPSGQRHRSHNQTPPGPDRLAAGDGIASPGTGAEGRDGLWYGA